LENRLRYDQNADNTSSRASADHFSREAMLDDLDGIVACHQRSFPGTFMTEMGKVWLVGLYSYFIHHAKAIKIVVEARDKKICGFAFGGDRKIRDEFFVRAAFKYWPMILMKFITNRVVRKTLKDEIFRKIESVYKKNYRSHTSSECGLLSICVVPELQGAGLSGELIKNFTEQAFEKGYNAILLSVRPENVRAVEFYKKHGWRTLARDRNSEKMRLEF
jgi:ribosomal protein S18 acetylase RimI-like enzyme